MSDVDDEDRIARKFAPRAVRLSLIRAGLFLTGWELLRSNILDGVRDFFICGWARDSKYDLGDYDIRVLSKHKSPFEASLLWLIEVGALTSDQISRIQALRAHRNELAHELPRLMMDPSADFGSEKLHELRELLGVLGRYWGRIAANTHFALDGVDVEHDGIQSTHMLIMDWLVDAADAKNKGE